MTADMSGVLLVGAYKKRNIEHAIEEMSYFPVGELEEFITDYMIKYPKKLFKALKSSYYPENSDEYMIMGAWGALIKNYRCQEKELLKKGGRRKPKGFIDHIKYMINGEYPSIVKDELNPTSDNSERQSAK